VRKEGGLELTRKEQVKRDSNVIEKAMMKYSGTEGAHFGFIAYGSGERQFFAGGRADITGMCISEAIATLVKNTPGITDDFIDAVAETARIMLGDMEHGGNVQ
jgi:hypothetical protein